MFPMQKKRQDCQKDVTAEPFSKMLFCWIKTKTKTKTNNQALTSIAVVVLLAAILL